MHLIVGLGNPGSKYVKTRHNIGFLALEAFISRHNDGKPAKEEYKALTRRVKLGEHDVLLAAPQTFMNLSGESVQPLMAFYKVPLENLLVIHDEVDVPFMKMKFQEDRSAGGNNGIKSIHQVLGTQKYARLRLGVSRPPLVPVSGKPEVVRPMDTADWVLQNFSSEEWAKLPEFLGRASEGIESFVKNGLTKTANVFNS